MLEKDKVVFLNTNDLKKTEDISSRASSSFILQQLQNRFPDDVFEDVNVTLYDQGRYGKKANLLERLWGSETLITGLPAFYEVSLFHSTGQHREELIVWSPIAWNDRFAGTAGGGIGTGGRTYLTVPNNTSRGWTVPYAVMNGFTAATIYAANSKGVRDFTVRKDKKLDRELYENWRIRSTHNMTLFGKAIAEILHGRKVKYSYMNGGSGGGRQSLMEVQNYPDDYDGVWASCPAINWHRFLLGGLWPQIVMKEHGCFIDADMNQFFVDSVHEKYGGDEAYYKNPMKPEFNAYELVGRQYKNKTITEKDAEVMNEIWKGPHRRNGEMLWYGYYPGVRNWQVGIPIGTYYYPFLNRKRIKPFILGPYYARWIKEDLSFDTDSLDWDSYVRLFDEGAIKFSDNLADNVGIDDYVRRGGKLLIDHGMDDPLIPTEGTIDYYRRLCDHFGSKKAVDAFCKVYILPGDSHGNCWGNGPGITQSAGMQALMDWVEKGIEPDGLRKVRVDRKTGELLEEGIQHPFKGEW